MSFSSRSSNRKHYKNAHHGNDYYQKKGFMGKLFGIIDSESFSRGSRRHYNNQPSYNEPLSTENNTICHKCNAQIPAGSKFCLQCGEKVSETLFCPNCGEKLPPNSKFCLSCGTKVNR